ncbi:MAG: transketolase, partial [Oscillospiraceae bacterium]|nr:transketolase [Oscillospiraceae bacterium]
MSITNARVSELEELCRKFRVDVLTAIHGIQSGHPGGSLSVCEIMTLLMQERMNLQRTDDPARDRLVLSKGHAAPMLYRNLIEKGFLPADCMGSLRRIDSLLQGHPSVHTPGVEIPAGPLGLGLSAAQGMAIALRAQGHSSRVWAILGDGELDEGCIWEAAMSAPKFGLNNLCAIVDWNGVQLDGTNDEVMPLGDLAAKWAAFGWNVIECDGHDIAALDAAMDAAEAYVNGPSVILAKTVKG